MSDIYHLSELRFPTCVFCDCVQNKLLTLKFSCAFTQFAAFFGVFLSNAYDWNFILHLNKIFIFTV